MNGNGPMSCGMNDNDADERGGPSDNDMDEAPGVRSPRGTPGVAAHNNAHSPGKTPDGKVVFSRED